MGFLGKQSRAVKRLFQETEIKKEKRANEFLMKYRELREEYGFDFQASMRLVDYVKPEPKVEEKEEVSKGKQERSSEYKVKEQEKNEK